MIKRRKIQDECQHTSLLDAPSSFSRNVQYNFTPTKPEKLYIETCRILYFFELMQKLLFTLFLKIPVNSIQSMDIIYSMFDFWWYSADGSLQVEFCLKQIPYSSSIISNELCNPYFEQWMYSHSLQSLYECGNVCPYRFYIRIDLMVLCCFRVSRAIPNIRTLFDGRHQQQQQQQWQQQQSVIQLFDEAACRTR